MAKMKKSWMIAIAVVLVLLVLGLIGSSQTKGIGTDCDIGLGDDGSVFCWTWHQNAIGDFADAVNDVLDGTN